MNKTELTAVIAAETGESKANVGKVIDTLVSSIITTLSKGEEVAIAGFGKFVPQERDERQGRNPATGETLTVAATVKPKFTPAKPFKDAVAESAAKSSKKGGKKPAPKAPAKGKTPAPKAPAKPAPKPAARTAVKEASKAPAKKVGRPK